MKISAFFLIMFLLAACARESKDNADPSREAPPETAGHESEAGPQSPVANPNFKEQMIERRLRENYAGSTSADGYLIINRGKFGQSAAIISRPAHYTSNADAERDTLQTTWQNDLASLPFLSDEISGRFRQHGLQDADLVFLRDEVTCELNETGSDYHELWDVADLDGDGNNEIIFQVYTCSECYELRVYSIGSAGNYILAYSGGGYGA